MKHIYFVNERIRLRAMEPEDLELICEMENDRNSGISVTSPTLFTLCDEAIYGEFTMRYVFR